MFFVLSGFLIGGAIFSEYENKGNFSFGRFYKNRILRIYPVYLFATLVTILSNFLINDDMRFNLSRLAKQLIINLFFLQTYIPYLFKGDLWDPLYTAGGSWSLVIEWFFYLLAPLFLLILLKSLRSFKRVLIMLIIIYLSTTFVRLYVTRNVLPDDYNWFFAHIIRPHSRYDELVGGVIVAWIVRNCKITTNTKGVLMGLGILMLSAFYLYFRFHPSIFYEPAKMTYETLIYPVWLSIAFSSLLMSVYAIKIRSFNLSALISAIARLSYPLYLFHILLANIGISSNRYFWLLMSLIVSYLVSLLVEYPFLRLYKNTITKSVLPQKTISS